MNTAFTNASSPASLTWLMEQKQKAEIGQRIKDLRENSAETNRSIGDYCGVGERSVAAWVAGKGLTYEHAEKVAELFGADIDWLWRGGGDTAGAVLGYKEADVARAIRTEAKLDALLAHHKIDYLDATAPQGDQLSPDPLTAAEQASAAAADEPRRKKKRNA